MLKGKVAVVTGSTSGIGLGIAKTLANEGCNIVLNGFGEKDEIENIRSEIETKYSVMVHYSSADLSDGIQAEGLITEAIEKLGQVDILVNNAGIQHVAPIEDFPPEKWEKIISINLSSSFYTISNAVRGMKEQGWGRIVNIASAHGLVASPNKSAYVAAKHGLVGLTKVVALENATENITCNVICPGWVLTPLVQQQINDWAERDNISVKEAEIALLSEKQPSLRFVKPEDIGEMIIYLCSESAQNITGTSISIDGGWTAK